MAAPLKDLQEPAPPVAAAVLSAVAETAAVAVHQIPPYSLHLHRYHSQESAAVVVAAVWIEPGLAHPQRGEESVHSVVVAVAVQELGTRWLRSPAAVAVVAAASSTVAAAVETAVAGEEVVAVETTSAVALKRHAVPAESVVLPSAFEAGSL